MTDSIETKGKPHVQEVRKGMSRRRFLKILGLGAANIVASSLLPDKNSNTIAGNLLTRGISSIVSRGNYEEAAEIEKFMMEETHETGNPNHLPYIEILKRGIEVFQSENPDTPIVWNKSEQYLSDYDAMRALTEPIKDEELTIFENAGVSVTGYEGTVPLQYLVGIENDKQRIIYTVFYNRLPFEAQEAINTANTFMTALPGTELYTQHYPEQGNVVPFEEVDKYYENIKTELEGIYLQESQQELLSMPRLLHYFLEKNSGNLRASLGDTAGFLKYMVRGDDSGEGQGDQIGWLQLHIQDQLNKNFSLNNLPPYESLTSDKKGMVQSIWGLQYHIPHLVYLLTTLSPQIVRAAVLYEYSFGKHVAGAYKQKVDIEFMDSLNDIFAYLQNFSES